MERDGQHIRGGGAERTIEVNKYVDLGKAIVQKMETWRTNGHTGRTGTTNEDDSHPEGLIPMAEWMG
jgi:hypothetical protein